MAHKIKVAIVINDFLVGGAQKLVVDLLTRLDRTKFEPSLITLFEFKGRETLYHLLPSDIVVHRLAFSGFKDTSAWITFLRLLRREKYAVVLSHLFFSNTVTRILKPLTGFRVFTVEHNTYVDKTKLQIWLDRLLARVTEKIVAVSPAVKDFTVDQERIAPGKFVVIRNGIDVEGVAKSATQNPKSVREELNLSPETRLVITVGRMTAQKNLKLMVEAFALFAKSHPTYHLVMLGDGGLRSELEALVRRINGTGHVHVLGNRPDVPRYLAQSDFFLSTSHIEGLSIAHLEALACGVPLLATRTSGSEEVIKNGHNGYFIEQQMKESVAEALVKMADADLMPLKQHAHETASRYDISQTVQEYEQLLTY